MKSALNWFEIPTVELKRAVKFYEAVLGTSLKVEEFNGTPIAVFHAEDPGVGGALIHDARRKPSPEGAIVYLDARGDLDGCLARVERAGGRVLLPKLDIGGPGFIAIIADSEGNQVGLHSPR
jgi:predicted enzyme related to lactoylglutathione lyase